MKIRVFLTEKQQKLYNFFGADPEVVLQFLNREVLKIFEETGNIYGSLAHFDEELVVDALLQAMEVKKKERLEQEEINKKEKEERERRKDKMGRIKERSLV